MAPDKLEGGAKSLIAQRHGCVDDVLAVAAHHHEPAVGVVRDGLGVDLARAHVLHGKLQALSVHDLVPFATYRLQVALKNKNNTILVYISEK